MNRAICILSGLILALCTPLAMGQYYYHGMAYYGSGYRDQPSSIYYPGPTVYSSSPSVSSQDYYHGLAYYGDGAGNYAPSINLPASPAAPMLTTPYASGQDYYHGMAYYGDGARSYSPSIIQSASPAAPMLAATPPAMPSLAATDAYLEVIVPNPQARVWVNGHATTSLGTNRLYVTTPTPGSTQPYRVRASWKDNGQDVSVEWPVQVTTGRTNWINFNTAEPTTSSAGNP